MVTSSRRSFRSGRRARTGDPYLLIQLDRFEDEDLAEVWLEDDALEHVAEDPLTTAFKPLSGDELEAIEDLGDWAVAAYLEEDWGGGMSRYAIFVEVDDIVAQVVITAGEGVDLDVAVELAEAQAECLEAEEGCWDPMTVPAGLQWRPIRHPAFPWAARGIREGRLPRQGP